MSSAVAKRTQPLTDEQLAARARGGDRAAFAALYRRHVGSVYGRITRLLGPTSDREDVTQEVFSRLHRALPGFRGDCRFTTFLYRVVASAVHDHLRARKRRPLELRDDLDTWLPAATSAEQRLVARHDLELLFRGMQRMAARKRIAFWLTRIEGFTCAEAGDIVGAPGPTVKQRARAAERELRRYLAKHTGGHYGQS